MGDKDHPIIKSIAKVYLMTIKSSMSSWTTWMKSLINQTNFSQLSKT